MDAEPPRTRGRRASARRGTVREVAAAAGVSTATVSRVFSRATSVRPSTREAVLTAARALGYRANRAAQSLVRGSDPVLGVLLGPGDLGRYAPFLEPLSLRTRSSGILIALATYPDEASAEATLESLSRRVDAVLVVARDPAVPACARVAEHCPVALMGRPGGRLPALMTRARSRQSLTLRHLRERGHRRIAWVGTPPEPTEPGTIVVPIGAAGSRLADGRALAREILEAGVSAVVAFEGDLARGIAAGARERGATVPGDLSIVGGVSSAEITSVAAPPGVLAGAAADLIGLLLGGDPTASALRTVSLEPELSARASTGEVTPALGS